MRRNPYSVRLALAYCVLAILGLLFTARSAEAQAALAPSPLAPSPLAPSPPALDYVVSAGLACPDGATFEALVESRLGRSPFDAGAAVRVQVRVYDEAPDLVGDVRWIDADGTEVGARRLRSAVAQCEGLLESMAVAVSILLEDPPVRAAVISPPGPAPPSDPRAEPPSAVGVAAPPADLAGAVAAEEGAPWGRLVFGITPTASVGVVPGDVSVGGQVHVGLRWPVGSLAIEGGLEAAPGAAMVGSDSIDAIHYRAGLRGCLRLSVLEGCALAEAGALQSTVQSVASPTLVSATFAVGLALGLDLVVSEGVVLSPWVAALVPLLRTSVVVGAGSIWETSWVTGRLGFDVRFVLP